jgi:hypothetical protein
MHITSLAALKRALKDGAEIVVLDHQRSELIGTRRRPDLVQSNGYHWFEERISRRCFAPFPKASQVLFNPDGTIQFHSPRLVFRLEDR